MNNDQELLDACSPAVVRTRAGVLSLRVRTSAAGSAFLVTPDGDLLTNAHVVQAQGHGGNALHAQFDDGTELPARLASAGPDTDLAPVRVSAARARRRLRWSGCLKRGLDRPARLGAARV